MTRLSALFLTILCLTIASCGGGGGGGGNEGNPAKIRVDVSPRKIDSGDRVTVTLEISDVDRDLVGLLIKVLYPSGLSYIEDTTYFSPVGSDEEFQYERIVTASADEATYYLLYVVTNTFVLSDRIEISFVLEGTGEVENGRISVDVDSADEDLRTSFDPTNPQFTSVAETSVEVLS